MRQFRMPIQHTKNLSKFKKQIGSIIKDLREFEEKEKYEALSYLQGCIPSVRVKRRRKHNRKLRLLNKSCIKRQKQVFSCLECEYTDFSRKGIFLHIQSHSGFPLSCRKCRTEFRNSSSFQWHLKFRCRPHQLKKNLFSCSRCSRKFFSKQNLTRHLEGHERNNCTYCDHIITNRKHLIQHLQDVHSIKLERAVFKCIDCDKRYVKERSLFYHRQQHFKDKFVCLECGKVFEELNELNDHQQKHEHQKSFKCSKCGQKFTRRQQYLIHMKKHDNYKCITCNETFASKIKMIIHKQKGHNIEGLRPKYSCSECNKEFFQKSKMMFHMRRHTEDKTNIYCQYCEKSFQSPYAYYKHSITVAHEKCSPETSVYICENCGGQFPKKYLLEQHNMRIHKNQKEFITCEFCSYKTKNKANMNRHKDTHITNGKTFICEQCGKKFANLHGLKGHIAYMHKDNKEYHCNICPKTFKRNSELMRHKGSHSEDRPHVCKICGQSYKRSTHLKRHEKSAHKIISPTKANLKLQIVTTDESSNPVIQPANDNVIPSCHIEPSISPDMNFIDSEPLNLKKKEYSDRILVMEPASEMTYFDNINVNNANSDFHNIEEEDIILDMSMISNHSESQYFLNTPFNNDQLIREYIEQDNFHYGENQIGSYGTILPSNRYILNNVWNSVDHLNGN